MTNFRTGRALHPRTTLPYLVGAMVGLCLVMVCFGCASADIEDQRNLTVWRALIELDERNAELEKKASISAEAIDSLQAEMDGLMNQLYGPPPELPPPGSENDPEWQGSFEERDGKLYLVPAPAAARLNAKRAAQIPNRQPKAKD
jgi:hypothetical protein